MVRRPVLMLLMMLRRRSRRSLASGVSHSLETSRQLQHLRAEGVKGGHSRGWRLAFREPELVGVEGSQLGLGRRGGSMLWGATAPTGAFAEEESLPGTSPLETCELSESTESFNVLSKFGRFVNLKIFFSLLFLFIYIYMVFYLKRERISTCFLNWKFFLRETSVVPDSWAILENRISAVFYWRTVWAILVKDARAWIFFFVKFSRRM